MIREGKQTGSAVSENDTRTDPVCDLYNELNKLNVGAVQNYPDRMWSLWKTVIVSVEEEQQSR